MKLREYLKSVEEEALNPGLLYHVTFQTRVKKIQSEGIVLGKRRNWNNRLGDKLGERKAIYLFSNPESAVRWAAKMEYDFKRPIVVVVINGDGVALERDDGMGLHDTNQSSLKTYETIPASKIVKIVPVTLELRRRVVYGSKEPKITEL